MTQSWLEGLNPQQKQAVLHREGPLVIFAGAGSGKTRVITSRIAHLVYSGVMPWNILALTFTNKAAGEMRERLSHLCPEAHTALVSTFHSACARWLREFGEFLGFSSDFSIYDDSDTSSVIKAVLIELAGDKEGAKLAPEMKGFIHAVKTAGLFPRDVERLQGQMAYEVPDGGIRVYKAYQEALAKSNAMDFNDLLLNMILLLRSNAQVKNLLQQRFAFVMVDEYQDTNPAQFELIGHIVEQSKNLVVVGDDDQSIYSWRGATPANIIDFNQHYPDAEQIVLETNYRSTSTIVDAATEMIKHNLNRVAKKCHAQQDAGDLIEVQIESDNELEAWWIADSIIKEKGSFAFQDVAIFYRTNAQSRQLEDALLRSDIPYQIFGAVRFYDRLEVKDVMAFLRLLVNPKDDVSLRRVINIPARGIGDKAIQQLESLAKQQDQSLLEAMDWVVENKVPRLSSKILTFKTVFDRFKAKAQQSSPPSLVNMIVEMIDYAEHLKKKFPDQYLDKMENIAELGTAIAQFCNKNPDARLADWMQEVSLVREESEDLTPGVSMMTLHMAKGLEFERVYIAGAEEGLLPHRSNLEDAHLLEEERRLFYVGMTRARRRLSISAARMRRTYAQTMHSVPSRFLSEIPSNFLKKSKSTVHQLVQTQKDYDSYGQVSYEYLSGEDSIHQNQVPIVVGVTVVHDAYGRGTVVGIDEMLGNSKIIVEFWDFGKRSVSPTQLRPAGSSTMESLT